MGCSSINRHAVFIAEKKESEFCTVFVLPDVIPLQFCQKYIIAGVTAGAVKG